MECLAYIEAEITFLSTVDGGREELPTKLSGNVYRPHLVVGDKTQRQAIVSNNIIQETYLGVAFDSAPENVALGKPFLAKLTLIFWPHSVYKALVPATTFTIREGARIVGYGKVTSTISTTPNEKKEDDNN